MTSFVISCLLVGDIPSDQLFTIVDDNPIAQLFAGGWPRCLPMRRSASTVKKCIDN